MLNSAALKMLISDRAKYLELIFTVGFSSLLWSNQTPISASILARAWSQIIDVADVDLWVMDAWPEYVDEAFYGGQGGIGKLEFESPQQDVILGRVCKFGAALYTREYESRRFDQHAMGAAAPTAPTPKTQNRATRP